MRVVLASLRLTDNMMNIAFSSHSTDTDEVLSVPRGRQVTDFLGHVVGIAGDNKIGEAKTDDGRSWERATLSLQSSFIAFYRQWRRTSPTNSGARQPRLSDKLTK